MEYFEVRLIFVAYNTVTIYEMGQLYEWDNLLLLFIS